MGLATRKIFSEFVGVPGAIEYNWDAAQKHLETGSVVQEQG